jgi:hypothetical protein
MVRQLTHAEWLRLLSFDAPHERHCAFSLDCISAIQLLIAGLARTDAINLASWMVLEFSVRASESIFARRANNRRVSTDTIVQ